MNYMLKNVTNFNDTVPMKVQHNRESGINGYSFFTTPGVINPHSRFINQIKLLLAFILKSWMLQNQYHASI